MDISPESVMTGLGALGGGGVAGWFMRIIYAKVTALDTKLETHDRAAALAIAGMNRHTEESRESSRELRDAMSHLTQTVDRLAVVLERNT